MAGVCGSEIINELLMYPWRLVSGGGSLVLGDALYRLLGLRPRWAVSSEYWHTVC